MYSTFLPFPPNRWMMGRFHGITYRPDTERKTNCPFPCKVFVRESFPRLCGIRYSRVKIGQSGTTSQWHFRIGTNPNTSRFCLCKHRTTLIFYWTLPLKNKYLIREKDKRRPPASPPVAKRGTPPLNVIYIDFVFGGPDFPGRFFFGK